MDEFTKEGRKLRPRRTAPAQGSFEKVDYTPGEHRSSSENGSSDSERRNFSGGYQRRGNYGDRSEGGYQHRSNDREGGYQRRGSYGDQHREGGYQHRSNYGGGYQQRRGNYGGGYDDNRQSGEGEQREGGYQRRSGYGDQHREGGYQHRSNFSGGYQRRGNYGGGYSDNRQGGEGEQREGGERRQGGFSRGPRQFGGNRGGGYNRGPRQFGSDNRQGGFGGRRNAGPHRQGGKRPAHAPAFTKESNEGMERMLESRPVINGRELEETSYETPIKDTVRLNKFIANSGVCSRREADTLIQAGVVTVNGEVVTELGTKVNVFEDDIRFNGERLKGEEKVYIIMNKPKGFVTTASDPHAEKTVLDLVKNCSARVYPVGRLDKNTTGVLMLTNDGEIAERLTHPSYDKKKIYQVALDRPLTKEDYDKILSGVELTDGVESADTLEYLDEGDQRKLGIEIHSGKNRIVRRIFESLGYTVKALDRVYFAGLTKKGLKKGEWRYLTEGETNILKMGAYI